MAALIEALLAQSGRPAGMCWPGRSSTGRLLSGMDRARRLSNSEVAQLRAPDPALQPCSFVGVHSERDWIARAQQALADPESYLATPDGRLPVVVVCADQEAKLTAQQAEQERIEGVLRQPVEHGGGDGEPVPCDPVAVAQELATTLFGADPAALPRLLVAVDDVLAGGFSAREVFLSPSCRGVEGSVLAQVLEHLQPAVLHVVRG